MIYSAWYRLSTIDVPVVIVDLGNPNSSPNFDVVNILIETLSIVDVKHRDVSIIEIHIACCGQCNVSWQSGCDW